MIKHRIPFALFAALATLPAAAAPPRPRAAEIAFADHGGVSDWRAEGDRTVYFEDTGHHWYKALLFAPAFDLPYVEAIGIDAGPTGTLDRFGAITVHGHRYAFTSFEAVAGPPSDKRAKPHPQPKATPKP